MPYIRISDSTLWAWITAKNPELLSMLTELQDRRKQEGTPSAAHKTLSDENTILRKGLSQTRKREGRLRASLREEQRTSKWVKGANRGLEAEVKALERLKVQAKNLEAETLGKWHRYAKDLELKVEQFEKQLKEQAATIRAQDRVQGEFRDRIEDLKKGNEALRKKLKNQENETMQPWTEGVEIGLLREVAELVSQRHPNDTLAVRLLAFIIGKEGP